MQIVFLKRDGNYGGLGQPTHERDWKACRVRYGKK
jgi:hypothetical protein